jgi:hypothetical protein
MCGSERDSAFMYTRSIHVHFMCRPPRACARLSDTTASSTRRVLLPDRAAKSRAVLRKYQMPVSAAETSMLLLMKDLSAALESRLAQISFIVFRPTREFEMCNDLQIIEASEASFRAQLRSPL